MIRIASSLFIALALFVGVNSASAATYIVTKIADTNDGTCDADCSLREAIVAANGTVDNDNVAFALPLFASLQTITLSGGEIVVANNGSLTIYGTGANRLTISGNNASRILVSGANVVVNIHGIRFTAGNGMGTTNTGRGGAIYNVGGTMLITNSILTGNSAANGGALNNAASTAPAVNANLTLVNCIISNNSSTSSGGAMQNFSTSTLHIRNSTVNNNHSASTGIAGAFQANGTVTITNTTFSGNTSAGTGGGVYYNGTSLIMTNTSLVNNTSPVGGGGFHRTGTTATANVRNSIIADNTGAATSLDAAGVITSQGNNIIESVGTSTGWLMSDQQGIDPLLAPLGFYGGFGMTHLPLAASTAVNMGDNCVLTPSCTAANPPVGVSTDQRGAARPFGAIVDIGAVETSGDFYAVLPSAVAQVQYNFTLVPATNNFIYTVNSGGFGGLTLDSGASATVLGNAPTVGTYDALVHINRVAVGQTFQNYRINVLADANLLSVFGRVVTSDGRPVTGARVRLLAVNGPPITTITNGFGYFRMDSVPAGLAGTISVISKSDLVFTPQVIIVSDVIDNLELRAAP